MPAGSQRADRACARRRGPAPAGAPEEPALFGDLLEEGLGSEEVTAGGAEGGADKDDGADEGDDDEAVGGDGEMPPAVAQLHNDAEGWVKPLGKDEMAIGRSADTDIVIGARNSESRERQYQACGC